MANFVDFFNPDTIVLGGGLVEALPRLIHSEVTTGIKTYASLEAQKGLRVVPLRIGLVLSPAGGALAKMLLPFKLGAGGVVGTGQQYMSWITLDDVVGVIHHALLTNTLQGPVNAGSAQIARTFWPPLRLRLMPSAILMRPGRRVP